MSPNPKPQTLIGLGFRELCRYGGFWVDGKQHGQGRYHHTDGASDPGALFMQYLGTK